MRLPFVLLIVSGCAASGLQYPEQPATTVLEENALPGLNDWWVPYPQWSAHHEIEAYTDRLSYEASDRVRVMLSTTTDGDPVSWKLLRTGWYNGVGAREINSGATAGHAQPLPTNVDARKPVRAGWDASFSFELPRDALSGVYALRLDSAATGKSFFVTFVVRQDQRRADLLVVRADFTDEAYNDWDGNEDQSSSYKGATWVSFDRPLRSVGALGIFSYSSGYFVFEYPLVRWLERNGYDVTYVSDLDLHESDEALQRTRALIVSGHDEYWSPEMRDHVQGARDHGLNLGLFGSDLVDGDIRFFPGDVRTFSRTVSDTDARKNEWANKPLKASGAPHDNPSDTLTGTHLLDWCKQLHPECLTDPNAKLLFTDDYRISEGRHPIFRAVDTHQPLQQVLGYEYEAITGKHGDVGHLHVLAQGERTVDGFLPVMTAYVAGSGAKVANLGSMHWSQALDGWAGRALLRTSGGERPCEASEVDCFSRAPSAAAQITTNILSDFGVYPADAPLAAPLGVAWPR